MELQNKNVVITGGSRGIGEHMARKFAAEGAHVLLAARSEPELQRVADSIGGEYLVLDLLVEAQVDGFVPRCLERLGHIDVFINNAGMETEGAFVDVPRQSIRDLVRVNLEAPALLTRDVLPHLMARPRAHLVQLSSVAGTVNFPGLSIYGATKAGLTHLTESIRLELKDTNVGFTLVAPGPVDSEMWDRVETGAEGYAAPAIRRFKRLLSLPKVSLDAVSTDVVAAVKGGKRFVRGPVRFAPYHMLNNAPRRLMDVALTGVKLPR